MEHALHALAPWLALTLCFALGCSDDTPSHGDPIDPPGADVDAGSDLLEADQSEPIDSNLGAEEMGELTEEMNPGLDAAPDGGDEEMGDMSAMNYPPVTRDPLGGARPAQVILPAGFDNSREVPLVLALHGYSGNSMFHNSYFGLVRLVDERDFVLVSPEGTRDNRGNRFWNATPACCDAFRSGVDDAKYLRDLIEEASTRFRIDTGRVYLLGHSNGGFMSYRMACDSADVVTGVLSLAGASFKDPSDCEPSEPVRIVQMHGSADATILYGGGSAYPTAPLYPSAEETVSAWASYNGCSPGLIDLPTGAIAGAASLPVKVQSFEECPPQGSVELWTIQNGGHIPTLPMSFAEVVLDHLFAVDRTP